MKKLFIIFCAFSSIVGLSSAALAEVKETTNLIAEKHGGGERPPSRGDKDCGRDGRHDRGDRGDRGGDREGRRGHEGRHGGHHRHGGRHS